MTISNEPGYYEDQNFGIRIENILVTVEASTPNNFMGKKYCKFDELTMCPIKTSLVNIDLLDEKELLWLNSYNARVRHTLDEMMKEYFPEASSYLYSETEPIRRST